MEILFQWRNLKPLLGICLVAVQGCLHNEVPDETKKAVSSFEVAMDSKKDLWGEEAMAQPNGPSYEFFKPLLPPPKYVNADFRLYPILLSAPFSTVKARIISDGSGVNIRGGSKSWRDVGTPFLFRVGLDEFLFGSLPDRLYDAELAEGWLPIPNICYEHRTPVLSEGEVPLGQPKQTSIPEIYRVEAFASTDSMQAMLGLVYIKFDLKQGNCGYIAVESDKMPMPGFKNGRLIDEDGNIMAFFDDQWLQEGNLMKAQLKPGSSATLAVLTSPVSDIGIRMSPEFYNFQREKCVQTWKSLITRGMQITTPEKIVNHCYKNSLCQIFELINGDEIRYSSGNQYNKMYEAEGSDVAMALLKYGYEQEMKRLMLPLFHFTRAGLELHHASFKLHNLSHYYWQTRDRSCIDEFRQLWEREIQLLVNGRSGPGGLYPAEQYCGDIHTYVQSLNVNAQAWKAMRNMGVLLTETGYKDEGSNYLKEASEFRKIVLEAVGRSAIFETEPPFIPVSLSGGEPVHDPILHSRIGSYWNIIIGYTLSSGIFPPGSPEENWIPHYQERHGGLCMGMVKSGGGQFNFWTGEHRINPLYGSRYALDVLRRDEPERALVSFYGMLAQGVTPNTFVGGEGSTLEPVDEYGRFFYCPPNSAASAHILSMLRFLLVQDWDLDDDGIPETLRLAFATPRRWLENGQAIRVDGAPTVFGNISYTIESNLEDGQVIFTLDPPERRPKTTLIRIRVPDRWKIRSGNSGCRKVEVDAMGTADISWVTAPATIYFNVIKK